MLTVARTYTTVLIGRKASPGQSEATTMDGTTCDTADIERLKKNAHHVVVRPGTRPSKTANHATIATPAPGANKPVAVSRGSITCWYPVLQGIGRSAAIWVPTARYRSVNTLSCVIGFTTHPRATIVTPAVTTPTR